MCTLIVIDFQKDFINGTLPVPGAKDAEDAIYKYIVENHPSISEVLFTVDWHSPNHCSFKKNGGIWPAHCVQFSEGAGISDRLIQACMTYDIPIKVFKKGTVDECEEYGAFEYIGSYEFKNEDGEDDAYITIFNVAHKDCQMITTSNVVVCGLAGDYCVKESISNLLRYKGPLDFNVEVLKKGVSSIDGGETFNSFIKENNIKTI